MAEAGSSSITQRNVNFFRCSLALLDVGTPALRKMLKLKIGLDSMGGFLNDTTNKTKFMQMNSKVLPKVQFNMLYPVDGSAPDIESWDITLLSNVLINACNLTSEEVRRVNQLRGLRNKLYGHKAEAGMDDVAFENTWTEIEDAIEDILTLMTSDDVATGMRQKLHCVKTDHLQNSEDLYHTVDRLFHDMEDLHRRVDDIEQTISSGGLQQQLSAGLENRLISMEDIQRYLLEKYASTNVPVVPLLDSAEDVDVSELYVNVTIHDITDQQRFNTAPQANTSQRINSYDQLFQSGTNRIQKRLTLLGNAGSGKSTYCHNIIKTWRSALDKRTKGDQIFTDDEKKIMEFDLVFFIPLCEVIECNKVGEMIEKLYLQHGTQNLYTSILYCLGSKEYNCMLIFDGLDEWGTESGKGVKCLYDFPCITITATRHWAREFMPRDSQQQILEIKPMDEDNTRLLAGNVLYHFYGVPKNRLDSNVGHFLNEMKQHNLMEITEIPLMLTYFVCLWYEQSGLDSSMTTNYAGILENLIKYAEKKDATKSICSIPEKSTVSGLKLPGPLAIQQQCNAYSLVLYELGKFAFRKCISASHETPIHSSADLDKYISKDTLDTGVRIGIITKIHMERHVTENIFCVRFLHKSIQDFLAALWIAGYFDAEMEMLKSYCSTLENLLHLRTVFRFICGLKPSLHNGLSKFAVTVASNSDTVQTYRHSLDNLCDHKSFRENTYNAVKDTQELLLSSLREARLNRKYIGSKKGDSVLQHHGGIFYIDEIQPCCFLQDVIMDNITETDVQDIFQTTNIKSVHIDNLPLPSDAVKDKLLNVSSIERLHLDQSISKVLHSIPCPSIRYIRSLSVSLKNVDCFPEHFSHMPHLSALSLCITCSHSTIDSLVEYFRATNKLVELNLEHIQCIDHVRRSVDCKFVIDISQNNKLVMLNIDNVSKGSVLLPQQVKLADLTLHGRMRSPDNVLCTIRGLPTLTHLTLGDLLVRRLFEWEEKDINSVIQTISTLSGLRYLHLMGIHFDANGPILSSQATRIETLYLEDIYMSCNAWMGLLKSMLDIQNKAVKTNVLINSSSIENSIIDFINEHFGDVTIDAKLNYIIIKFYCS